MDPLRLFDYLLRARERIFEWVRPLSNEQYMRQFPIGLGSLGRTLTHVMICEWFYIQRMQGRDVPPYETWPIQDEQPPPFATLEAAWADQTPQTLAALRAVRDWNALFTYPGTRNPRKLITATPADIVALLAFHEVHHRAQAMNMLRQLGIATADLDFNALMFPVRET
jgi:uncharacterized damage-inducible protein DinB